MSTRLDVRFLAGTQPVGYAIAVAATVARRMLSDARTVEAQAPPLTLQVHDLRTLVSPIVKMMDRVSELFLTSVSKWMHVETTYSRFTSRGSSRIGSTACAINAPKCASPRA